MDGNRVIKSTKDIAIIAIMTTILFVQEQLLSSLPGIQLSVFLIVLYSKKFGLAKTSLIVFLHVILDNFYMSSFSLMYTPTMLIGWLIIPLTLCIIFKKIESPIWLGVLGILYAFIYSWLFIVPNYLIIHIYIFDFLVFLRQLDLSS